MGFYCENERWQQQEQTSLLDQSLWSNRFEHRPRWCTKVFNLITPLMRNNVQIGLIFILFASLTILLLFQPYMMLFIIFLLPLSITYLIVGVRYIKGKKVSSILSIVLCFLIILALFTQILGLVLYPINYIFNPSFRIPLNDLLIRFIVVFGITGLAIYNLILVRQKYIT